MFIPVKSIKTAALLLAGAFFCTAAEFRVKPDDGSLGSAEKNWKPGDTIILAPGTYYNHFRAGSQESPPCGLTLKAAIPGSAVFRGDRKAPEFQQYAKGIWKAHWDSIPEAVFEHDTLSTYKYCATRTGLQQNSGTWTYDPKSKTLYVRTSDSADPARHVLSIGVTPWPGVNFFCLPSSSGVQDVLLDGFITTGFYSRRKFPDQRLPHSQRKVAWGTVVNHPVKNVKINNVTAVLNGYGIGFCAGAKDSAIENCRAFGNRNPFDHSGGGIGIFERADDCVIRGNLAGDNKGQDIWLYHGPVSSKTVFTENRCYGKIRTKAAKGKKFSIRNCVSMNSISFVDRAYHMSNSVTFGYTPYPDMLKPGNLLMGYENSLIAEKIFADPDNFDCRVQGGTAEGIAKRSVTFSADRVFYWKQDGKDSADGRSVENAFGSSDRVIQELGTPGTEIYIAGPVKGDLNLKGLKNITIRGRGAFPVQIQGRIILDNCSGIRLERLAPAEFAVRGGNEITITQSAGKITAERTSGLRLTHNYIPLFSRKDCRGCFITANVFEKAVMDRMNGWSDHNAYAEKVPADLRFTYNHIPLLSRKDCRRCFITANVFEKAFMDWMNGWSDYNAYAEKVPAGEKNSFAAKAELGKNHTFKNAWQFDGRSIDSMPVGPYRRQPHNVQFIMDEPEVQLCAPDMVIAKLTANIPFKGTLLWGDPAEGTVHEIKLTAESNSHAAALSGLKPGKKYFVQFNVRAEVPHCFSNAELKDTRSFRKAETDKLEFTAPVKYSEPQQYYVSKDGSDSNDGSKGNPFGTIGYAVTKLRPGDTLNIRGGTYEENFTVQVSGTREKPVVIRGAPGEKVYIQAGYGSPLVGGITVSNQNHIHFQDFCIYGDHFVPEGFAEYAIRATDCRGLLFQRLIVSGSSHKLHALNCDDIRIEDCGFSFGHEGVYLMGCKDMVIRNCTFAHAGLMHLMIRNERGPATVENCIFVDALNMKGYASVIYITDIRDLTERNNCFFNRMPFDQKPLIGWDRSGNEPAVRNISQQYSTYNGLRQQPYPAYQKDMNRYGSGSFSANPGLKTFPDFICKYQSYEDWKQNWKKNQKRSHAESELLRKHPELLRDLKYFLPTDPEVIKRGCGPRLK